MTPSLMTRWLFLFVCSWLCVPLAAQPSANKPPNFVLILIDDLGWPSLSSYGNKHVTTRNIDRLAREGMRFTDAYVNAQCTPTRASLLTGQHTARNGLWHVLPGHWAPYARMTEPVYAKQLPRAAFTLGKGLQRASYATAAIGKWHLTTGADGNYNELKAEAARYYGFDVVAKPTSNNEFATGDKGVNRLTDEAIQFIEANQHKPFFLYLAHHTTHNKLSAPADLVAKYRAKGYSETGFNNATFLACLEHLDNSVGRLLDKLDALKLRDDTLVMFLTDNGGIDTQFDPKPFIENDAPPTNLKKLEEIFDHAPLRAGKGSLYEGGIRVPFIARWPRRIKAGSINQTPVHAIDLLPTLLELAGTAAPREQIVDGVSLAPLFEGRRLKTRALYWYAPLYDIRWAALPASVIREGDYKLLWHYGDYISPDDGRHAYEIGERVELYNLRDDMGEQRNLAHAEPRRTQAMLQKLRDWHRRMGAEIPQLNSHYDARRALKESKERLKP
ncbi:MAG: sulfatase [Blastocatellia bacterium]|nr:sulfatase [Blastocatellia bacterium]